MALDYFAIISTGFFPRPSPTPRQFSIFVASWGLLNAGSGGVLGAGRKVASWLITYYRKRRSG